jgi:NADP-dependent 3-hydroxy acid dehydrogenase YdfG
MTMREEAVLMVTGASSGIGAALVKVLAAPGRVLHLQGRDSQRLREVAETVESRGATPRCHALDFTDPDAVEKAARSLAESIPVLDALVHSAGVVSLGTVEESDVAELDRQWLVNLRAPFVLTAALTPALASAEGQVIFVNSGAGLRASACWSQYASTKFGLKAIADAYRDEVADRGVRVSTVYPGRTATPMQAEVHRFEGREYDESAHARPEDVAGSILHALEMPRSAVVPEIMVR